MKQIFNPLRNRLAAFALGFSIVLAGSALAFTNKGKAESHSSPTLNFPTDERPVARDLGGRNSFAPIVKKVSPAVVKVVTTVKVQNAGFSGQPDMDDLLRRFFGDQFQGRMPQRNRNIPMPRQEGLGSGVIVTKDGYIVTNNHVVDGAEEVKVSLQDGRDFTAKVIGRDPKSDVAVIKIKADDLPALTMADSDKVEVGDVVLAIGNPFGIGQTVTTGIVSATGRAGAVGLDYEDFIQTDAAINPGNSGGALVDADGRLIGINTAILSRSGGNQGIGFAIPVNLAKDVVGDLVKEGHVTRGYVGAWIQDVTPVLAKKFDLKSGTTGALVGDIEPKGPADKAGLKSGDVVVEYNGKKVNDSRHFRLEVARTHPGETVPLKVLRDGSTKTVDIVIKELPGSVTVAKSDHPEKEDNGTLNGVTVTDLDSQARQEFKVPERIRGVIVTEVSPDSAAAESGIKTGDVIQEINRKPVKSAEEAVRMTEHPADKTTLLRVWRDGASHWVVVDESNKG
jgi:serine protease Do